MIISGLHCAMCTRVWWFTGFCVHIILYFNSIVFIDERIAIVDFDCSLDSIMGGLAIDGSIL
jgi:hypothetical protein